jgi:putative SOS response-associated peptidase YedK
MMSALHTRMPVILAPENFDHWLQNGDRELLRPFPPAVLKACSVSTLVSQVHNHSPDSLLPLS